MSASYPPGSQEAAVVQSIETFGRMLVEGDIDGWSEYWAEDGVLMPPGHPRVVGRADIVAYDRGQFGGVKSMNLSNWDVDVEGDLAVVTSDATWQDADGKRGTLKQLMALRRQPDGRWIRKTVIFNFDRAG